MGWEVHFQAMSILAQMRNAVKVLWIWIWSIVEGEGSGVVPQGLGDGDVGGVGGGEGSGVKAGNGAG
jgi:hypothetical protein